MLKRQRIKKAKTRIRRLLNKKNNNSDYKIWTTIERLGIEKNRLSDIYGNPEVDKKDKEARRRDFLLSHKSSRFVSNLSVKLRCQIKGCRDGAVTLKGCIKVCGFFHK